MSSKKKLEEYIHTNIPISVPMGISVECASQQIVVITAPLSNNINYTGAVFDSSLHAVSTLACWSLLHLNLEEFSPVDIVLCHSNVGYITPVTYDFKAQCLVPHDMYWEYFFKMLQIKGRGEIDLKATIDHQDKRAVNFDGTFIATMK